jgi:hypothetical protein
MYLKNISTLNRNYYPLSFSPALQNNGKAPPNFLAEKQGCNFNAPLN